MVGSSHYVYENKKPYRLMWEVRRELVMYGAKTGSLPRDDSYLEYIADAMDYEQGAIKVTA
ncbi:hypothetical protein KAW80_00080 [Candidatus Babeliales bacterium]|nr:hypothetical protein [Candidatus Babeliales bacterium]